MTYKQYKILYTLDMLLWQDRLAQVEEVIWLWCGDRIRRISV